MVEKPNPEQEEQKSRRDKGKEKAPPIPSVGPQDFAAILPQKAASFQRPNDNFRLGADTAIFSTESASSVQDPLSLGPRQHSGQVSLEGTINDSELFAQTSGYVPPDHQGQNVGWQQHLPEYNENPLQQPQIQDGLEVLQFLSSNDYTDSLYSSGPERRAVSESVVLDTMPRLDARATQREGEEIAMYLRGARYAEDQYGLEDAIREFYAANEDFQSLPATDANNGENLEDETVKRLASAALRERQAAMAQMRQHRIPQALKNDIGPIAVPRGVIETETTKAKMAKDFFVKIKNTDQRMNWAA
ncbi:hypothetical protein DFS34DRAFT_592732 [Phlyctochytrium arcticum]|nr:hypothetical protein DFS34DRAFT_592732 [Phlyctochytrium arcticum]